MLASPLLTPPAAGEGCRGAATGGMGWGEAGGLGTTRSNWLGGQTPARVLAAAGTRVGKRSAERPATGQPSDQPWINAGITSPDPAGNKQQPPPARAHPGQRAEPRPPLAARPRGPRWHRCPGAKGSGGSQAGGRGFQQSPGLSGCGAPALGAQAGSSCGGEMLQPAGHEGDDGRGGRLTRF